MEVDGHITTVLPWKLPSFFMGENLLRHGHKFTYMEASTNLHGIIDMFMEAYTKVGGIFHSMEVDSIIKNRVGSESAIFCVTYEFSCSGNWRPRPRLGRVFGSTSTRALSLLKDIGIWQTDGKLSSWPRPLTVCH